MNKRGQYQILEEVIFIVLNIIFFGALLIFVVKASAGTFVLEQFYAKQIALMIDGAKPGTIISLNVDDAYGVAKKNNFEFTNFVKVKDNKIIVQLSDARAYSYGYFNDIKIDNIVYSDVEENGKISHILTFQVEEK